MKQSPHPKLCFDVQSFHDTLLLSGYSKTPRERASYQARQSKGLKVLLRSQKQKTDLLLGEVKFLNHIPNKNMSGYIFVCFFCLFIYLSWTTIQFRKERGDKNGLHNLLMLSNTSLVFLLFSPAIQVKTKQVIHIFSK